MKTTTSFFPDSLETFESQFEGRAMPGIGDVLLRIPLRNSGCEVGNEKGFPVDCVAARICKGTFGGFDAVRLPVLFSRLALFLADGRCSCLSQVSRNSHDYPNVIIITITCCHRCLRPRRRRPSPFPLIRVVAIDAPVACPSPPVVVVVCVSPGSARERAPKPKTPTTTRARIS